MPAPGRILVGTSGWAYPHWRGVLYPHGLPQRRWLERYAEVFGTVELNATFYRLPTVAAVTRWHEEAPPGFVFACKGSRYLTHMKRLRDAGAGLDRFFERVAPLGRDLAVVLWQLPPQMVHADPERLDAFLAALPRTVRHAVEFRAEEWYQEEVCRVLDRHGAALCEHDLLPRPPPRPTGGFRYLRFHGASARYAGRYGRSGLREVAADLRRHRDAGGEVFVYFNNDTGGAAVRDAMALKQMVAGIWGRS